MFFFGKNLKKNKNLLFAIKSLNSYGLYRHWLLRILLKYQTNIKPLTYSNHSFLILKYLLNEVLLNIEMDETIPSLNIQLKKNLQSYQGLRLHLNLPVNGQWTWTNASTQWLLARIPWRRHFTQWKNRRKFAPKDPKRFIRPHKTVDEKLQTQS